MNDFKDNSIQGNMLDKDLRETLEQKADWQGDAKDMWNKISTEVEKKRAPLWKQKKVWISYTAAAVLVVSFLVRGSFVPNVDGGKNPGGNGKQQIVRAGEKSSYSLKDTTPLEFTYGSAKYGKTESEGGADIEKTLEALTVGLSQKLIKHGNPIILEVKWISKKSITIGPEEPVIEIYSVDDNGKKGDIEKKIISIGWAGKKVSLGDVIETVNTLDNNLKPGEYRIVYRFRYIHDEVIWEIADESIQFTVEE